MPPRNLITDVAGVRVGNAHDDRLASGVTVVLFDKSTVASGDVRGGGPGTRETDLLDPTTTVEQVDAIVISGGSAFGLDAGSGVQAWLRDNGRGFPIGPARVPIVPGAALFDLLNGANENGNEKTWARFPPYRELAYAASDSASEVFALGTAGAGYGATVANLKGGLGSASAMTPDGITVGAVVAVNAVGCVTVGDTKHFWAAPFEQDGEFGGHGSPAKLSADDLAMRLKGAARANTTLAIVATDAILTQAQAKRLAIMAQDGYARAIYPVHTPLDGDTVFAAATGMKALADPYVGLAQLGGLAANVLARAIARGVYEATALPFKGALPAYRDKFR
jgi:L-aminopeptidase/D-esterase-like protein